MGVVEGDKEGDSEGVFEGDSEGRFDGLVVGILDGDRDGDATGLFEGDDVGNCPPRPINAASACTKPYPYLLSRPGSPRSFAVLVSASRTSTAVFDGK